MYALRIAALLLGTLSLGVLVSIPMSSPAKAPALEKPGLTGKVTLDGDRPDETKLNEAIRDAMRAKDERCLAKDAGEDETIQQVWRIDDKGGVANVFVWIVPAKGKFFKVDMDKKTWADEVKLEQPHCAFIPHCMVLFPYYLDENGKRRSTGQKFVVTNTSAMNHNTKIEGGFNEILPAGKDLTVEDLQTHAMPMAIGCNIHTWMSAYLLALDHPYAAITGKDGTYKIENVPVGEEVRILAWHEKAGFLNENRGAGEPIKLETSTVKNFKCKAK